MDKRIQRTTTSAQEAALEVLARSGFASFTMEAVAAESGIAKSTLYRHWPTRIALLADALETLNRQPQDQEKVTRGEFRARVVELVTHLAAVFHGSRIARVMPALIEAAEHHAEVAEFLQRYSAARRKTLEDLLRTGVEIGELTPDLNPQLVALVISGPIFYCRYMTPSPFPIEQVPQLVGFVLGEAS